MRKYVARAIPYAILIAIIGSILAAIWLSWGDALVTWKSWEREHSAAQRQTPALPVEMTEPPGVGELVPGIDQVAREVLSNIRQHGWNPAAETRGAVTGGLYINWQMDDPHQTNALRQGLNQETSEKHDNQVDLYYLNALAQYQALHPRDRTFAGELQRALKLVKSEFRDYNLPKGWIYFFLLRDGLLLHDSDLLAAARTAAEHYYRNWYDPAAGLIYNRRANPGNSNVEHTLNCGAALIDAGMRWDRADWVNAGETTIQNTIKQAYNPKYHLFYNNFLVKPDHRIAILNAQAKPSTQGNGVTALLAAYNLTKGVEYLEIARQTLTSLFSGPLWDTQRGGLYFALDMANGKLNNQYKETRGQTLALIGLYRYNQLMLAQKQVELVVDKQLRLIDLLRTRFYQATYHGFFYRVTPGFGVYSSEQGRTGIGYEKFFTTEAMGTALDALQQTEFSRLQI
jgi:hypothetical protein